MAQGRSILGHGAHPGTVDNGQPKGPARQHISVPSFRLKRLKNSSFFKSPGTGEALLQTLHSASDGVACHEVSAHERNRSCFDVSPTLHPSVAVIIVKEGLMNSGAFYRSDFCVSVPCRLTWGQMPGTRYRLIVEPDHCGDSVI
jgi:hypothetical protein